jgi:hypothetical protein
MSKDGGRVNVEKGSSLSNLRDAMRESGGQSQSGGSGNGNSGNGNSGSSGSQEKK